MCNLPPRSEMTLNIGCISGYVVLDYSDRAFFAGLKKLVQDEVFIIEGEFSAISL